MVYKLVLSIIAMQSIVYVAANNPIIGSGYHHFKFDCNFILSSMQFRNSQRCVQFIFGHEFYTVECIKTIMEHSEGVTFYVRSLAWLFNRNVHVEDSTSSIMKKQSTKYCENFLILLKDLSALKSFLKSVNNNVTVVTIFPYTKLYFLLADETFQFIPGTLAEVSRFFYENAQFGFVYEFLANTSTIRLENLLSLNNESEIQSNFIHPILNRENDRKGEEFRLSFYNCYPFVIYVDEDKLRFDGIEYRLVQEVTKNWKVKHILRDESKTGTSPWITMFDDLENRTADLAMCSIWTTSIEDKYDVSTYYNHECCTLMVPKPHRLSEMTAIYKTLTVEVWLTFGLFFLATVMLLRSSALIDIDGTKTGYVNVSGAFLDVASIATQHGVDSFWKQRIPIKILLLSWIYLSSLVGMCYTTIYTSRLTKPGYTKLIDTVEDFIETVSTKMLEVSLIKIHEDSLCPKRMTKSTEDRFTDMTWGTYNKYGYMENALNLSSNPAYKQLRERILVFKNRQDAENRLATGKFGVYAGISNSKYFVTYYLNEQLHLLTSFRLMKKICLFQYYAVFGLQRFSPYTELFSRYALLFQEYGITQFWFKTVYRDKSWMNKFFEDHPEETSEPKALHFATISGALLLLFLSHTLSIIVFACEIAVKKWFP